MLPKQVGPALFFFLLIYVVSFLPVFPAEAQEGRMFRPLAWTKTLAGAFRLFWSITLVPMLMLMLIKGLRPESRNPVSRVTPSAVSAGLATVPALPQDNAGFESSFPGAGVPSVTEIGSQFMPPLFEGSSLYMPTALPGIGITQATQLLQEQDRILRGFPEVESVFGVIGPALTVPRIMRRSICTTPQSC